MRCSASSIADTFDAPQHKAADTIATSNASRVNSLFFHSLESQVRHALQRQLPQVAHLHAAGDQRHGDVALDAVHAHLRGGRGGEG